MELSIDLGIFPMIMSMHIGLDDGEIKNAIELPRAVNRLYLAGIKDRVELDLLKKYSLSETFTDDDYEHLLKLFVVNVPRTQMPPISNMDFLSHFGIVMFSDEGKIDFKLNEAHIPIIKADTWECIALDVLRQSYSEIISLFDFGDVQINLWAWKTDFDDVKQSILSALRSALFFTFIGYLHGDDKHLYTNFMDFFENEFYKRVALVHAVMRSAEPGAKTKYIPLFDCFYNLRSTAKADLIKTLQTILGNDEIALDERQMIINRLIDGADVFHSYADAQSIALEQSLIKPVVNYIVEIQTADEDVKAAITLKNTKHYNKSISISYYAMMHATKALLEHKNMLHDWEPDELNVNESHRSIENKLVDLKTAGVIPSSYIADFQNVKQKRWVADYTLYQYKEIESNDCINRATAFIAEVKRLTT